MRSATSSTSLGASLLLALALTACAAQPGGADLAPAGGELGAPRDLSSGADQSSAPDLMSDPQDCLPREEGDLTQRVMAEPFAGRNGPAQMTVVPRGSAVWEAGRSAALAWARGDCPAFLGAAQQMGYRAVSLRDSATGQRHWLLTDAGGAQGRYNGVFAFRHPAERDAARPLVIDAPHRGYDWNDDRAVRAYRQTDAVAFLQNTAHRCNLADCSGCSAVQSYPCGCERESDVVHSTNHLYYAVYDGLESARDDLHLEYHGAAASANAAGCVGTAHVSQASSQKLSAAQDDGTYPNRFWQALQRRLGDTCVCYHQRETGCQLNGFASTCGRRTNQEAGAAVDTCTTGPAGLARRFVHFEAYNVSPDDVIAALQEAIPVR